MQTPKSTTASEGPAPDTYQGILWDSTNASWHKNSTVLSHWFYLLCQGGTGPGTFYDYKLTSAGVTTIIQNVSVPSGRFIQLEQQPTGIHVVTGDMTANLTVTYNVDSLGVFYEDLFLKFSVM